MSNIIIIMSNKVQQIEDTKKYSLFGLSVSWGIWFIAMLMKMQFQNLFSSEFILIIELAGVVFMFSSIWFGYRLFKINRIEAANPNLASQINDERQQLVRLKSLANGFIAMVVIYSLYLSVAVFAKVLFDKPMLYQISAAFIGGLTLVIAYFVAVFTFYHHSKL